VLAGPHARIDNELEGTSIESQESGEATQVDGPEKLEELDAVFWVLGEVLVDHVQSALENTVHNVDDLVLHHALFTVSIRLDGC
jgi:hypothetical protein